MNLAAKLFYLITHLKLYFICI